MTISEMAKSLELFSKLQPNIKDQDHNRKSGYDLSLEGLRGCAAFSVGLFHVFAFKYRLDPSYSPNEYLGLLYPGIGSVMIFFMISGYVIGLTNRNKFSQTSVINYFIRRAIRILPIYWIVVIFSFLIYPVDRPETVLGNLLLLQEFFVPTIKNNTSLWSLSYEVGYYVLFPVVWYFKPKMVNVIIPALAIGAFGWFLPELNPKIQLFCSFLSGWVFWILGLWLAWKIDPSKPKKVPLLSYFLLFIAFTLVSPLFLLLKELGLNNPNSYGVNFAVLGILPICLFVFAEISNRRFWGYKFLYIICLIVMFIFIALLIIKGRVFENSFWIMPALLTFLSVAFWKFKTKASILAGFAPMGQISYAFYILHMPVMKLIHDYFPWQGSIWSFTLRFLAWLTITIFASVFLELMIQPIIKRRLSRFLLPQQTAS